MITDFQDFVSVVAPAIRAGVISRPVEVWATGASGGLWGAFCAEDGTWEKVHYSPVTFPVQLFLFDQDGNVSKFTVTAANCGESVYERAC